MTYNFIYCLRNFGQYHKFPQFYVCLDWAVLGQIYIGHTSSPRYAQYGVMLVCGM